MTARSEQPELSMREHRSQNEDFLEYLFKKHVEMRLPALWDYWKPWKYPWGYIKSTLAREAAILRFINTNCNDLYEVAQTFRPGRFEDLTHVMRQHAGFNEKALEIVGLLDCFESNYDEIMQGFSEDSYSDGEHELLRDLGVQEPDVELRGILSILQARREAIPVQSASVVDQLKLADVELKRAGKDIAADLAACHKAKQTDEAEAEWRHEDALFPVSLARFRTLEWDSKDKRKARTDIDSSEEDAKLNNKMRPFKALGEITIGVTMSLGDLAVALGSFQEGRLTQQEVCNLFVSTGTGIGVIGKGLGELRGE